LRGEEEAWREGGREGGREGRTDGEELDDCVQAGFLFVFAPVDDVEDHDRLQDSKGQNEGTPRGGEEDGEEEEEEGGVQEKGGAAGEPTKSRK